MPRLIALTGLTDGEQRSRILSSGFDCCLAKPLDFEALVEALRQG
jgi:DNA-binding response OmpR family regulator